MNEFLTLMQERRSIRKYQDKQVPTEILKQIIEAGLFAPNAGGGQRCKIIAIHNRTLTSEIGKLNIIGFNRSKLAGNFVSYDQPSIIDDPALPSGFYGAPTVCAIFGPQDFLYSIPDAYCCADNMVLAAQSLGIASCIVARGEETFDNSEGKELLKKWNIADNMVARCFVLLGYCEGAYPEVKQRKAGRSLIVEK